MKTQLIIAALLLSAPLVKAQTQDEKPVTVRVKKTENINGVKKMTDTTYTVNGPLNINAIDGMTTVETGDKEGSQKRITIITDEVHDGNVTLVNKDDVMDAQLESALKAAGVDGKALGIDKIMVLTTGANDTCKHSVIKNTKIVIVKTLKIVDASEEDTHLLSKTTGTTDRKLAVDNMSFYPNPNTGKFNLAFSLPDKGTTEITILNTEGKQIYSETLRDFKGSYDKEIDISENPKGIYFVRIEQGKHAQLKKIILE